MIVGSVYVTAGAILDRRAHRAACAPSSCRGSHMPRLRCAACSSRCVELLAGIPSVVYGFFGLVVIVPFIGATTSVGGDGLSASWRRRCCWASMILPTIVTVASAERASDAVPRKPITKGALALGADARARGVPRGGARRIARACMAGIVLGVGRAIGETMAVIMVAGNQARIPARASSKGVRTHDGQHRAWRWATRPTCTASALIATGVVLFVFILLINHVCSTSSAKRGTRRA